MPADVASFHVGDRPAVTPTNFYFCELSQILETPKAVVRCA
jgi:hypothetical protein